MDIWLKHLNAWETYGIVFLNQDIRPKTVTLRHDQLGLTYGHGYQLRDVLNHKFIGYWTPHEPHNYTMPATGALMIYAYGNE